MIDAAPLIVSLGFDEATFLRLDTLRRAHFPPALNRIPAHLTLFHHLPGDRSDEVEAALAEAARATSSFALGVSGLRKLGRGVALTLASPVLSDIRARIAATFADVLTPQDRQGFRPHVTIQNKVDPKDAAALYDRLAADFTPWTATAEAAALALSRRPVGGGGPVRSCGGRLASLARRHGRHREHP